MKPQPRTPRQQKLWWCSAHNIEMKHARNAPVAFVLSRMPTFLESYGDRIESAKNNLHQYLGSNKPGYWSTRPAIVAELCEALSLTRQTWEEPDIAVFVERAVQELAAKGILDLEAQVAVRSRQAEFARLSSLPIEDGRDQVALQRDELALGGFRRSPNETRWPHVRMSEPVRVQILLEPGNYVVAFTVDPHGEFCALLPSDGSPPVQSDSSVFLFPEASARPMYPPDKADWHELLVAIGPTAPELDLSQLAFGEPLAVTAIKQLVDHCEHTVASGGALKRLYFHVSE